MRQLSRQQVQQTLARHIPMYRWYPPAYQHAMLNNLAEIWEGPHARLLDIGGGTGIIAEAMKQHFGVERVVAIDVEDRFLPGLSVETRTYDGRTLPFEDQSFDAATINNVLHHVAIDDRAPLIGEIRRVVGGPLYVKDHLSLGRLDDARLAALDWIGNSPFRGMVRADYLSAEEWRELAERGGYEISHAPQRTYRRGPFAFAFPNRLEVVMKWTPARC